MQNRPKKKRSSQFNEAKADVETFLGESNAEINENVSSKRMEEMDEPYYVAQPVAAYGMPQNPLYVVSIPAE